MLQPRQETEAVGAAQPSPFRANAGDVRRRERLVVDDSAAAPAWRRSTAEGQRGSRPLDYLKRNTHLPKPTENLPNGCLNSSHPQAQLPASHAARRTDSSPRVRCERCAFRRGSATHDAPKGGVDNSSPLAGEAQEGMARTCSRFARPESDRAIPLPALPASGGGMRRCACARPLAPRAAIGP